jgi:hypothetical protein
MVVTLINGETLTDVTSLPYEKKSPAKAGDLSTANCGIAGYFLSAGQGVP